MTWIDFIVCWYDTFRINDISFLVFCTLFPMSYWNVINVLILFLLLGSERRSSVPGSDTFGHYDIPWKPTEPTFQVVSRSINSTVISDTVEEAVDFVLCLFFLYIDACLPHWHCVSDKHKQETQYPFEDEWKLVNPLNLLGVNPGHLFHAKIIIDI